MTGCRRMRTLVPAALAVLTACATISAADEAAVVYTVNYPLAYFAERIGGGIVTIRFPAPADVDPAFWKPDAEIVLAYQDADLIVKNGASYAKWTRLVSLPRSRQVDTSRSFSDRYLAEREMLHSHGPTGRHSHSGVAFTTWLDPEQAIAQARAIEEALSLLLPEEATSFADRADALETDLEALHRDLVDAFSAFGEQPLLASHPVYQYLARRYELDLSARLWEPNATPDAAEWRQFDAMLADRKATWMLWESEPTLATRAELDKRGIGVIVFSPCANRPRVGDYLSVMRSNVEAVRAAGRGEPDADRIP